ncbi:hypothetical protein D5085_15730 [Ectothiorhodospiraceae bacterium BW-2]|nr:hypothetical protein D5085_15730 [Ectothiorhodospiraceae bacterium BW-2]
MPKSPFAITLLTSSIVLSLGVALSGCSATAEQSSPAPVSTSKPMTAPKSEAPAMIMEVYEIHHEGRINLFYDKALYHEFAQLHETPFRLTRIGAGPNGETVVFGLTDKDKKKPDNVDLVKLFDGKMAAPADFYGEMRMHGRIYVFDNYEDMKQVRQVGEPSYFYSEIGSGPNGETVKYVLNSSNNKKRPDALIAKFKAHNR